MEATTPDQDKVKLIECNVADFSPELSLYLQESLKHALVELACGLDPPAKHPPLRPPPALLSILETPKPEILPVPIYKSAPPGVEVPNDYRWCVTCQRVLNRKHTHKVQYFPCPYCGKDFTRKDNIKAHIRSFHQPPA